MVYRSTPLVYSYSHAPNDPNSSRRRNTPQWQKPPTPNYKTSSTKDSPKTRLPDVSVSPARPFSGGSKKWVYRKDTKVYLWGKTCVHPMCTKVHKLQMS